MKGVIVERDDAFRWIVVHGETGFMASDSDEMSFYARLLAQDSERLRRMSEAGRRRLERVIADERACFDPWRQAL